MVKLPAIITPRRKEVTTRVTKTTEVLIKARASFLLTKARSLARAWLLTSVLFFLARVRTVSHLGYADIGDTVYYSTGTKRGKCYLIVTESAKESFVGRTASLVTAGTGPGHFQRVMSSIGTTLLVLCVCDFYQSVAAKNLRADGFSRVIIWLLAVWIGGFFRGVNLATPKDNNLLVYTLIFLVRATYQL
jgi:magnesium-transporting ATPase (P-type)